MQAWRKWPSLVMVCGVFLIACSSAPFANESSPIEANTVTFEASQEGIDLLVKDTAEEKALRVRVGIGFGTVPDYVGSNDMRLKVLPILDVRYGKRWRLNNTSLRYNAYVKDGWQIGPLLKYKAGRKEARNEVLRGLGDVKATAQVGAFAKYKTEHMLFNLAFRQSLGAGRGNSVRASLGHALFKKGKFGMAAALSSKWMSGRAMQTSYGVTAAQAAGSAAGLTVFSPKAGISELTANIFARYRLSDKFRILGLASFSRLLADAKESPLVTNPAGSVNQVKVGIGFTADF